jgi:HPt (histidine-containing phosphotransfer) domain-containing protein
LQVIAEQSVLLAGHVERVGVLAGELAKTLGQPSQEIQRICLAARLHDIGKTAIPALILHKPSPLGAADWAFLRLIPVIGERIVSAAPNLASTAPLIRSSHERIDGHGYPDRLAGQDIPLGSRIIAVCDAFDVMTSLYGKLIGTEAALEELERHAGTQFDATIVEAFCAERGRWTTAPTSHEAILVVDNRRSGSRAVNDVVDVALRSWTARPGRHGEAQDLDREVLRRLQVDLGGDPLVLLQIVRLFIEELNQHVSQIEDAARERQLEMLACGARHVRPGAEVLGATALADVLIVLEDSAESRDVAACDRLAGALAQQVARTYTAFETLVEELDAAALAER